MGQFFLTFRWVRLLAALTIFLSASGYSEVSLGLGKAVAKRANTMVENQSENTNVSEDDTNVPATALALTGPASGPVGFDSTPFTVRANGALSLTVAVNLSDSGNGGVFTPASLTLTNSSRSASFTYRPTSSGNRTISITNTGSLADPTPLGFSASSGSSDVVQFLTHDDTSAPTKFVWNAILGFPWKRGSYGDWLDANRNEFGDSTTGATPYASFAVPAPGVYTANVTALVQRWLTNGENRGFYLRMRINDFPVQFAGRADPDTNKRPKLIVTTNNGETTLDARCNATWNISTYQTGASSLAWALSSGSPTILQFDLAPINGTVTNATLRVTDTYHEPGSTMANGIVDVFEADPPRFVVPDDVTNPVLGLAANVATFQDLISQPGVIFADDFESPGPFDGAWDRPGNVQRLLNPLTNTIYARADFVAGVNESASRKILAMRGANGERGRGMDVVYEDLYTQYYLYLESDYGSNTDGIKIPAMGCQFGWWNTAGGGYWQMVTGNGGSPGTGLLVGGTGSWAYEGHSVRLLTSMKASDDSAYKNLFTLAVYAYHLDQGGPFPPSVGFNYVAIQKEKWYAIDQRMKQNTMSGAQDALGNYATANPDGIYQVWINGYPSFSKSDWRWRRHPDFGVEGFWLDFYHGGTSPAPYTMHYRVDRVSAATSYIGPAQ